MPAGAKEATLFAIIAAARRFRGGRWCNVGSSSACLEVIVILLEVGGHERATSVVDALLTLSREIFNF